MKLLLDTNAFLWQISEASKLGPVAKKTMLEAETVYVSAITIMEMHIKTMFGKLNAPHNLEEIIKQAGNTPLAFSTKSADNIRVLAHLANHDPFDRMLLSQAQTEELIFVTADDHLLSLNFSFVVNARQ